MEEHEMPKGLPQRELACGKRYRSQSKNIRENFKIKPNKEEQYAGNQASRSFESCVAESSDNSQINT